MCNGAYRFLRRLDGEDPELAEDPVDRDRLHDLLLTAGTS
jgi:L-alanine-DL-glutamate epimerase-like enolase superfamily enzyme